MLVYSSLCALTLGSLCPLMYRLYQRLDPLMGCWAQLGQGVKEVVGVMCVGHS